MQFVTSNNSSVGASGSSSSSSSSTGNLFHNRKHELECLSSHCSRPPTAISVILGPRSTGKTALLREYMASRGLTGSQCFIDARATAVTTPSALASELQCTGLPQLLKPLFPAALGVFDVLAALRNAFDAAQDTLTVGDNKVTISGKAFSALLGAFTPGTEETPPLDKVIKAYITLLDLWDQARAAGTLQDSTPPVLVIDEANVLMEWGEQYEAERRGLLRFFITLTKVQNRSHVLLATSDYSFQTWLSQEIGPAFFGTFVIGDFAEEDARQFLDKQLSWQQDGQSEVPDDDWSEVYKVCGGNAGALKQAAAYFVSLGGWQPALSQLAKDVWGTMQPIAGAAWTSSDYAAAVKAILESPYNAVDRQQLLAVLGKQPLATLVQANQLALRPYSSWATDINPDAFGPDRDATVATAPTSLHLYLMRRKENALLAPLNSQQAQAGDSSSSSSSSRPPSPSSAERAAVAQAIAAVSASIQAVEDEIKQVVAESKQVRQDRNEGWLEDLAHLQERERRLAGKEKQLREQLRQLREEKLLLMKREDLQ